MCCLGWSFFPSPAWEYSTPCRIKRKYLHSTYNKRAERKPNFQFECGGTFVVRNSKGSGKIGKYVLRIFKIRSIDVYSLSTTLCTFQQGRNCAIRIASARHFQIMLSRPMAEKRYSKPRRHEHIFTSKWYIVREFATHKHTTKKRRNEEMKLLRAKWYSGFYESNRNSIRSFLFSLCVGFDFRNWNSFFFNWMNSIRLRIPFDMISVPVFREFHESLLLSSYWASHYFHSYHIQTHIIADVDNYIPKRVMYTQLWHFNHSSRRRRTEQEKKINRICFDIHSFIVFTLIIIFFRLFSFCFPPSIKGDPSICRWMAPCIVWRAFQTIHLVHALSQCSASDTHKHKQQQHRISPIHGCVSLHFNSSTRSIRWVFYVSVCSMLCVRQSGWLAGRQHSYLVKLFSLPL